MNSEPVAVGIKRLYGNLCAGMRMAFFLRLDEGRLQASTRMVLVLILLDILIRTIADFLVSPANGALMSCRFWFFPLA